MPIPSCYKCKECGKSFIIGDCIVTPSPVSRVKYRCRHCGKVEDSKDLGVSNKCSCGGTLERKLYFRCPECRSENIERQDGYFESIE